MKLLKNNYLAAALLLVLVLILSMEASAQVRSRARSTVSGRRGAPTKYYGITVGTGIASYFGDLCPTGDCYTRPRPQFNLGARMSLAPNIGIRAELAYYNISSSDAKFGDESRKRRNLEFYANNIELSATGQFDFVPVTMANSRYSRRSQFNMYGFLGVGITTNNPKVSYQGKKYNLRTLQTEGTKYSPVAAVVPLGIGARIKLDVTSDILIEAGYRYAFTDHLDDVSADKYLPASAFGNPTAYALSDRRAEVGTPLLPGHIRGNSAKKDSYYIFSVKYLYTFTKSSMARRVRSGGRGFRARYPRYK